jgi:nitrogenase subunit NifH
MGNDLNNKNNSEEIDLLQLFGFFEGKLKGFFKLIFNGIKSVFDVLISFLQVLQQNFIKIAIAIIVAFGVGYVYDMNKPKIYSSKMIVKPLFDSKYQLVTNIHYYNELVGNKELGKLGEIFSLSKKEAESLSGFDIKDGPESEKEKTRLFNSFMKSLDSAAAATVTYDKFVENITIYDASLYEIEAKSSMKNVFEKLSKGFKETFKSKDYSEENKLKKETLFKLKKASIEKSLSDIDSLKKVYITEFSKNKSQTVELLGSTALKLVDQQQKTKEFELLQLQIAEQNKLTILEEDAIKENQLFEVVSDFQLIGSVNGGLFSKMKFMFPIAALILVIFGLFGMRFNKFVANYNRN